MRIGAHLDDAAAGRIRLTDAFLAEYQTSCREIRALDDRHEFLDRRVRIIDEHQRAIDNLTHIMRRDIRSHTNSDTRSTIDQQLRELRRQNRRLLQGLIVVRYKLDRLLINILQHEFSDLRHTDFRITHCCRRISIDRTKVAVTICQHVTHREILRHTDNRIIDRAVTMRMIFTENFTDDTRRFLVRFVGAHTGFLHGIQDAAVYRLQAVPDIWQGTSNNNAHRIIDVAVLHLMFQIDRYDLSMTKIHNLTSKPSSKQ